MDAGFLELEQGSTPSSGAAGLYRLFIDSVDGNIKKRNPSGTVINLEASAAGVATFEGRAGAVVSVAGDYTASEITNIPAGNIAAITVQGALAELDAEKEPVITNLGISRGGTNSTAALSNNRIMVSDTGAIKEAAAITGNKALVSNASGIPIASATSDTELGYVTGVTSAIQTQLNSKEPTITVLTIARGGTNSNIALNNKRVMISSAGAIVENISITAARALVSDADGIPIDSIITKIELEYLTGVTSDIQTQINGKEPTITTLSIAKGGTNSGTALGNNKVMVSIAGAIVESTITTTELGYLSGVTSAIQTQLDNKEPIITVLTIARGGTNSGAALANNKVMVSVAGAIVESTITTTELGYLSGVTSAIQTQFSGKQPLDATLTSLAAYNTAGILTQTAPDTFVGRTLQAGAGISITNGNGVSGDPTIASTITQYTDALARAAVVIDSIADADVDHAPSRNAVFDALALKQPLDATLTSLAAFNTNGLLTQTAADTFTARTITGTAGQITVTNGSGVAGNPTLSLSNSGPGAVSVKSPTDFTFDAQGRVSTVTGQNEYQFDPTKLVTWWDDFIGNATTSVLSWVASVSGAGTTATITSNGAEVFNRAQGSVVLPTGSTAAGRSGLWLTNNMGLGYTAISQQWRMLLSALSSGGDTFTCGLGFGDTITGASVQNQTNGVMFVYDTSVSTNWLCQTTQAGATTSTTTSVAVSNTAYNTFRIEINAAGTSVAFSINGTVVATHTTNIPGFLQPIGGLMKINKTVGTTSIAMTVDYFWMQARWGTPR